MKFINGDNKFHVILFMLWRIIGGEMRIQHTNNLSDKKIQSEYAKIDKDWLELHYRISIGTVLFALVVECIMSFIVVNSDMLTTSVPTYIFRFIVAPSVGNLICIGIDTVVIRLDKVSQEFKINTISIVYVIICFVLFTSHNIFIATYYIFSGAIILTVVYASRRLTIFIAAISMILLIFSEIFIVWDVKKSNIFEDILRLSNFLIALAILVAFSVVSVVIIEYEKKKNLASIQVKKERALLEKSLKLDELTGIFNRKALHDGLKDLQEYSLNQKCIFIIMDIDRFKTINDNWGHQVGDQCLVELARLLKESCGKEVPFRYGGDEFCMLFYNTDIEEAINMCKKIQDNLKDLNVKVGIDMEITASFGLAEYHDGMNAADLFVCADQALYKAKKQRNKIQVYDENVKSFNKSFNERYIF